MAIVLSKLNRKIDDDHVYADLKLDLDLTGRDIGADYDEAAIANSLRNLFNTIPGERPLKPTLGIDLRPWLARPVTASNAKALGSAIENGIKRAELRVVVVRIEVVAYTELHEYDVLMFLKTTSLNTPLNIKGTMSRTHGFSIRHAV